MTDGDPEGRDAFFWPPLGQRRRDHPSPHLNEARQLFPHGRRENLLLDMQNTPSQRIADKMFVDGLRS
jgi:hypothetical protein